MVYSECRTHLRMFGTHPLGIASLLMVGFTGIRVTHPGWAKYPATLPERWERIEIERVWVRGEAKQLIAINGKPTALTD